MTLWSPEVSTPARPVRAGRGATAASAGAVCGADSVTVIEAPAERVERIGDTAPGNLVR